MPATPQSSLEVEDALIAAGERLGMKVLLLRLVAAELPDNPWLVGLDFSLEGARATATARHLCGARCRGDLTGCLTAFKIEDAVSKQTGEEFAIASIEPSGENDLRVELSRLSA